MRHRGKYSQITYSFRYHPRATTSREPIKFKLQLDPRLRGDDTYKIRWDDTHDIRGDDRKIQIIQKNADSAVHLFAKEDEILEYL